MLSVPELGFLTRKCLCVVGLLYHLPGKVYIHARLTSKGSSMCSFLSRFSDHFHRSWRLLLRLVLRRCRQSPARDNSPSSERDCVSHCAEGQGLCHVLIWAARLPSALTNFPLKPACRALPSPSYGKLSCSRSQVAWASVSM